MSGMIGADPDALERLAGDFDRGAGSLEAIVLRVRASVHANPWSGPRATRFRTDWDQRHGPQLKRTALTLRTAAKHLRLQAAEQRRASSAGGPGTGGNTSRGRGDVWSDVAKWLDRSPELKALGLLGTGAGLVATLGSWNKFQNYPKQYRLVMEGLSRSPLLKGAKPGQIPELMKFNKSPVLQLLERRGVIGALKPASTFLGGVSKGLGVLGAAASTVIDGQRAFELASTARSPGDWVRVTTHGVDAAANAAMASKVGFLPGLAAKSVAMAVREGSKSDFSASGQAMVYNEVVKNPGVLLDEFGKAGRQVGQEVASWFLPIEKGLK